MSNISRENLFKNIILVIILLYLYPSIQSFLSNAVYSFGKENVSSILGAVGIISVIACFGNFAFSYEKVNQRRFSERLLAHFTTGILMLVIGLSLAMTSVLMKLLIGDFVVFDLSLLLLYVASVLYDFWDLKRIE